jgi:hypothetical protein
MMSIDGTSFLGGMNSFIQNVQIDEDELLNKEWEKILKEEGGSPHLLEERLELEE